MTFSMGRGSLHKRYRPFVLQALILSGLLDEVGELMDFLEALRSDCAAWCHVRDLPLLDWVSLT